MNQVGRSDGPSAGSSIPPTASVASGLQVLVRGARHVHVGPDYYITMAIHTAPQVSLQGANGGDTSSDG